MKNVVPESKINLLDRFLVLCSWMMKVRVRSFLQSGLSRRILFRLLMLLGMVWSVSANAEWDYWVRLSSSPPYSESTQAQIDSWMSACSTHPIAGPQNLCILVPADGIKFWRGESSPCPKGEELGSGTHCSAPPVSDTNGGPICDSQTPNPVTIATGNKYQFRVDYRGAGDFPITFGFYFNSLNKIGGKYFSSHWTYDYSRSLSISVGTIAGDWGQVSDRWVMAKRDDGSSFIFTKTASGVFRDRDGTNAAYLEELSGTSAERWKLTYPGHSEEYYDQNGRLIRIKDASSRMEQRLSYVENQVVISHSNGDSITIVYPSPATTGVYEDFRTTTFPSPPDSITTGTGQFQYSYNNETTRLETVTFSPFEAGRTSILVRQYLYEDANHPQYFTKELDARGRIISAVTYYADGKVASSRRGSEGEIHHFEYLSDAKRRVTNSFGLATTYLFQVIPPHKLLTVNGASTSTCAATSSKFVYDEKDRKIGAINVNDSNRGTIYSYNNENRITGVSEGGRLNGLTPTYGNADARYTNFTYYSDGNVESATQYFRNGSSTTSNWVALVKKDYAYWSNGRIRSITVTDLSNQTTPFGETNGKSRATTYSYTYHTGGGVPAETLVDVMTVDGPIPGSSDISTFSYDINARLVQQVNAAGHTIEYRLFTGLGLPQIIEDSNGVVTAIGYHPLGWIESVAVKDPSGNTALDSVTEYDWYPNGTLKQITYPDGSFLQFEYNDAGHIVSVANNLGETTKYALNALGDWTRAEIKDPSENIKYLQRRIFDDLGRLRELLGNNGQRSLYTYDVKDNLSTIKQVGAFSASTTNYYDTLNRIIRVLKPRRTEVDGQLKSINHNTYYTYNILDQVTSVKDPKGNTTSYVYNGFGDKITQASPDTGVTQYWHDANGNLTDTQDARGVHVQYHHDGLGRLTWIEYPTSGEDVHYYYDEVSSDNPYAIGRLTRITDASGSTQYRYDHRGNITHDIRTIGSTNYTTEYQYNLANNLVSMVYPSGRNVSYVRADALGRITAMTTRKDSNALEEQVLNSAAYLPFGPVTRFQYGNGLARQVPYDLDYRIDKITVSGSITPMNLDYGYDAFNNITSILNGVDSQRSETFAYDDLQRLQHAYGAYGTGTNHIRYEYDPVGNRTLRALGQGSTMHTTETYSYDAVSNKLNSVSLAVGGSTSTRSLVHGDAGNLESESITAGPSKTYTYNDNNRLIELAEDNIVQGDYRHNALGQRVSKTTGTSTTHYLYGLQGELLAEANAEGQVLRQYLYLNGQLVGVIDVTN